MTTWKRNPLVLRTYGKHKTKVETWLSPDARKKAFSSTSSSDLSFGELSNIINLRRKMKRTQSTAYSKSTRIAKQKALTALRLIDSDEENFFIPDTYHGPGGQKRSSNPSTKGISIQTKRKGPVTLHTSESEDDKPNRRKKPRFGSEQGKTSENISEKCVKSSNVEGLPSASGKFVTDRRRMNLKKNNGAKVKRMKAKPNACIFNSSLDSTNNFVNSPHFPPQRVATRKASQQKDDMFLDSARSEIDCAFSNLTHMENLTKNVSMCRTADGTSKSCYKKPLLSSTPSLSHKLNYRHCDPSISKISFNNNDDENDALRSNVESTLSKPPQLQISEHVSLSEIARELRNSRKNSTNSQHGKKLSHVENRVEDKGETTHGRLLETDFSVESSQDCNFVSVNTSIDSLVSSLKESCRTFKPNVCLERIEVSNFHLSHISNEGEVYFTSSDCEMDFSCHQSGSKLHGAVELRKEDCTNMGNACQTEVNEVNNQGLELELNDFKNKESPSVVYISKSTNSLSNRELQSEGGDVLEPSYNLNSVSDCDKRANGHLVTEYCMDVFAEMVQEDRSEPCRGILPPVDDSQIPSGGSLSVGSPEAVLKERCISLQPTVKLKCLDLSKYDYNSRGSQAEDGFDSTPRHSFREEENCMVKVSGVEAEMLVGCSGEEGVGHELNSRDQNLRLRRQLSSMFTSGTARVESLLDSPPGGKRDVSTLRVQESAKDKQGTGRKACVSGLSVSRWTKKSHQGPKQSLTKSLLSKTQDHPYDSRFGLNRKCFDTMNSWLHGTSDLFPGTSMHSESMNVSTFLAGLGPDCLTTHTWSRLKAALSVHKKKKAFLTPKRQLLSHNQSSESELLDVSSDFLTAGCSPHSTLVMSRLLKSPEGPHLDITDAEKVYQECQQEGPITFEECITPQRMKRCKKIGEGTFGEVFSTIGDSMETVALKIIPIEGNQKVNGEDQKTFGEVLHEIIISKELSSLDEREANQTKGFIGLKNLHCVRGSYPELLLKAWDKFHKQRVSENDRPDFFGEDQIFVILEFEFGGSDLESMNGKISSMAHAKSILHQVIAALAVAEQALCFEHRDLHWGNILVKSTKEKEWTFMLNEVPHTIETKGVLVNIIDYSLSRLEIDDLTVSCDISADEELFMGTGDYQFDIYRKMREENNNSWNEYNPHTNVLWLHYLVDKLLSMKYQQKTLSKPMKDLKKRLTGFYNEVLGFNSATNVLECCSLFQ
uniref:Serine/threonine-protein kinase haspin n=1 Tax=Paramormyrops kingsleyae TaxID=1676925 RepID=A0A3B3QJ21_9TELE|nr:serine/threonine-protein kinase haspin isoform X1 [Paramormyrops kingsleyae]